MTKAKYPPEMWERLKGAICLLSIAKLPHKPMGPHEEKLWRAGFEAGAMLMMEMFAEPSSSDPTAPSAPPELPAPPSPPRR